MVAPAPSTGARQPALDGLRAVAVLAVVAYHAEAGWAPGGFLGVDVFFVLSGFLVTRILLAGTSPRDDLPAFWARRARRILPALLLLVAVLVVLGLAGALPAGTVAAFPADAVAALLSVANWRFLATDQGYFATTSARSLLEHTWSLSIEEQFYVAWAPVVALLAARRARRTILAVALVAAAASVAWMASRAGDQTAAGSSSAAYFDSLARVQGPLLGAALAVVLASPSARDRLARLPRPVVHATAGAALVAVLLCFTSVGSTTANLFPLGFLAVAGATCLLVAGIDLVPDSPVSRLLALPPVAALGLVSYGVYLWHWPMLFLVTKQRTGLDGVALHGLRLVATLAAATLSYLLLERPIRRQRWPLPRTIVSLAAAGVLVVAGAVRLEPPAGPAIELVAPEASAYASANAAPADPVEVASPPGSTPGAGPADRVPGTDAPPVTARPRTDTITTSQPIDGKRVRIGILGDSVAESLATALRPYAPTYNAEIVDQSRQGCGVMRVGPYVLTGVQYDVFEPCLFWRERWEARLVADRPDVAVFALGRHEVLDRMHEGRWTNLGVPAFDAYVRSEIEAGIGIARRLGIPVVLLTAPYYLSGPTPGGAIRPENDPARVQRFNLLVRDIAAANAGIGDVRLVDLGGRVSPDGMYAGSIDDVVIRSDGVHFAPTAGAWLAAWLVPELAVQGR